MIIKDQEQLDIESTEKWGKPYNEVYNTPAKCRFCGETWFAHSGTECINGDKYAYGNGVAAGKPGSTGASIEADKTVYVEY